MKTSSPSFPTPTVLSRAPGTAALLAALSLSCAAQAADLPFTATTDGPWTSDDSGAPLVLVLIDHPTVTSITFGFDRMVSEQVVDISDPTFPNHANFTFTAVGG